MGKPKYNFYNRTYLTDIIIVCISLMAVMWGAILNGAYIPAIIIILSTILLLGRIHFLREDVPKEDVFYVDTCLSSPIKLFGNYIQCIRLVPIETVRRANGNLIFAQISVLSISKTKFKASDCVHCRFIDNYTKGSFIQFYKKEEDS